MKGWSAVNALWSAIRDWGEVGKCVEVWHGFPLVLITKRIRVAHVIFFFDHSEMYLHTYFTRWKKYSKGLLVCSSLQFGASNSTIIIGWNDSKLATQATDSKIYPTKGFAKSSSQSTLAHYGSSIPPPTVLRPSTPIHNAISSYPPSCWKYVLLCCLLSTKNLMFYS